MKWLTQEQWSEYNNATNCSICTKPLNPADKKVLYHNHLTEEYRCPAHNTCNLNYHIHAFLFNIKNYLCEVRNIQRRKAELNVNLPRVNNSDIKQNGMEAVIQVACVVSWTSIFFCQIIVVAGFFICWLEWLAISQRFYWPDVVNRWFLWLGPGSKTFRRCHPLYSLQVVQKKLVKEIHKNVNLGDVTAYVKKTQKCKFK